ncbi:hypothetical protein COLO4_04585 [Corchorus olitorius]|uniref:Uncharacterized protein n=1 Tax=Corchorus olitorius TaxID=93759 RepID=A0A1R3KTD9_9ROSI|nr:hypothetical protein COLO4_04585 [Corchorus olitorius]
MSLTLPFEIEEGGGGGAVIAARRQAEGRAVAVRILEVKEGGGGNESSVRKRGKKITFGKILPAPPNSYRQPYRA